MREAALLSMAEKVRSRTLEALRSVPEEQAGVIPAGSGFRNNLRWQAGHILYTQEVLTRKFAGIPIEFGDDWKRWFGRGSSPADWTTEPPSYAGLLERLASQPARIRESLAGRLDERLDRPFLDNETVGEVFLFSLYHEGIHTGHIAALRKLVL